VILLDANLLIYAHVREMPRHAEARDWLDRQFNERPRVGLPWPSLLAFIRIVSNPRVLERPVPVQDAWSQVESWLEAPAAWVPTPTARHRVTLGPLLLAAGARANLVADAHLAALAIEHGLTLCSCDGDFARFPGLRWSDPLADGD
jgi:uncharacterized protein